MCKFVWKYSRKVVETIMKQEVDRNLFWNHALMWSELPNLIQEIREVKEEHSQGGQIAQSLQTKEIMLGKFQWNSGHHIYTASPLMIWLDKKND